MYLLPQIAKDAVLAKNVQQEPVFTSLRTVTAAEEIWYDPDPQSTIIEEDALFVESFAVPDEGAETTLHLQSYCGEFDADPFVIWSGDNSEKLIMRCEFSVAWIKMKTAWTNTMLNSINLHGLPGIDRDFLLKHDKVIIRKDDISSCVEIFNVLSIEAARAAFMKELRVTLESDAVGEKDGCRRFAGNTMFRRMAPMGTGRFEAALDIDMLKDVVIDHRLPVQSVLAVQAGGNMTLGQVAMTPYDSNSPIWNQVASLKGEAAVFSLAVISGYSPSLPDVYSPMSPYCITLRRVLSYQPMLLYDFSIVLPYFRYTRNSPNKYYLTYQESDVLTVICFVLSSVSSFRSDIPGIAEILSYLTRLVLLAQILHDRVIIKKDGGIWARQEKDVGDGQMDGTNLKPVMCIDGVDFKRTYSNSCVGIFNML
ncbi:hypothetical protein CERSUDRAFT_127766, partial [Gelatoporia subvermispora B]